MVFYESLKQDEEARPYCHREECTPGESLPWTRSVTSLLYLLGGAASLLLYTAAILYFARDTERLIASVYSHPWFRSIPNSYDQVVRFDGTFNAPSIYRGPPSEEIDAAWNATILDGPLNIHLDDDDLQSLGVDSDSLVRFPTGHQMVTFEFGHQMHCLNFLRMSTHRNYYSTRAIEFTDDDDTLRTHLDHCLEMLRQFLMCHADTRLLTAHWVQGRDGPYPDFNTLHQCRDWDAVVDWTLKHQAPVRGVPVKPLGVEELRKEP